METLRILVTDDEPGLRMAAERALRDFTVRVPDTDVQVNFRIETAETGEAALQKISDNPPDLLLLDHKLPGISGLDVFRWCENPFSHPGFRDSYPATCHRNERSSAPGGSVSCRSRRPFRSADVGSRPDLRLVSVAAGVVIADAMLVASQVKRRRCRRTP